MMKVAGFYFRELNYNLSYSIHKVVPRVFVRWEERNYLGKILKDIYNKTQFNILRNENITSFSLYSCGNTNTVNHGNLGERLFSISTEIIPQYNSHQVIVNVKINVKNILYTHTHTCMHTFLHCFHSFYSKNKQIFLEIKHLPLLKIILKEKLEG